MIAKAIQATNVVDGKTKVYICIYVYMFIYIYIYVLNSNIQQKRLLLIVRNSQR